MNDPAEVPLFVFADAANVSTDNKLNITGIFHFIVGDEFPLAVPTIAMVVQLVLSLEAARTEHRLEVTLTALDAVEPMLRAQWTLAPGAPRHMDLPDPRVATTIMQHLHGIVFRAPSTYVARVLLDDVEVRSMPLRVVTRDTYRGD